MHSGRGTSEESSCLPYMVVHNGAIVRPEGRDTALQNYIYHEIEAGRMRGNYLYGCSRRPDLFAIMP